MLKQLFLFLIISLFFLFNNNLILADELDPESPCTYTPGVNDCCATAIKPCVKDGSYSCQPGFTKDGKPLLDQNNKRNYQCLPVVSGAFGIIQAPPILASFLDKNPTGSGAISQFLSNGIKLIYSIAAIVLIFMILWGAFEWLVSGGDKEKLASAQKRIISAIIGIILFAVAFAIMGIIGMFTGFTFFI